MGGSAVRPRADGSTTVETKWSGSFGDYRSFGRASIPTSAEVAWLLPEGRFDYWRGGSPRSPNCDRPMMNFHGFCLPAAARRPILTMRPRSFGDDDGREQGRADRPRRQRESPPSSRPPERRRSAERARPADLRARRDHEPAADVGSRAGPAGENVPDRRESRRPRSAARLLPRLKRVPGVEIRLRRSGARRAHEPHRGAGRGDPDSQGPRPRAQRGEARQGRGARLRRRRDGGESRTSSPASPGSSPFRESRPSCSRRGAIRRRGEPFPRSPD